MLYLRKKKKKKKKKGDSPHRPPSPKNSLRKIAKVGDAVQEQEDGEEVGGGEAAICEKLSEMGIWRNKRSEC